MGDMEQHLGNATSTTILNQLRDLWRSPRGTVLRIEALALVSIALTFFLAAFGSCRRWSNRWIIQKGFLAANALSLSLGTYCIGIMQSSAVKNEMYPIWGVSLLTLFGCVDSITASIDYRSQLWKMLYQLCLYCGYVLLMSILTISSDVGNIAIGMLSVITFIKVLHRSLALVLPSRMRNMITYIAMYMKHGDAKRGPYDPVTLEGYNYVVDYPLDMADIVITGEKGGITAARLDEATITIDKIWLCHGISNAYKDMCLSFSLYLLLQRRFFGLDCAEEGGTKARDFVFRGLLQRDDYKRAFKVIEVELAFLYDFFFTSNAFLQHYEAKAATILGLASIVGIVFVGIAAVIPATRNIRASGGTVFVETTTADLVITIVILVSLALLQAVQLIRCWTSNWARVTFVCRHVRNNINRAASLPAACRLRLRALLTGFNWFDDNYLWQNKLGQCSVFESVGKSRCTSSFYISACVCLISSIPGSRYIKQVLQEMWGRKAGDAIELDADVKEAIGHSLERTFNDRLTNGERSLEDSGSTHLLWATTGFLDEGLRDLYGSESQTTSVILIWHVATCYCELEQLKNGVSFTEGDGAVEMHNIRAATALSKYCAYLVVSAPELLPGSYIGTRSLYDAVVQEATGFLHGVQDKYEFIRRMHMEQQPPRIQEGLFTAGLHLGKQLEQMDRCQRWKLLADFWAEILLFCAPSDNVDEHIRHLSQGGEFITHLWALLSHAGILIRPSDWDRYVI